MEEQQNPSKGGPWWEQGLSFFYQVSGWILGPIIIALLVGKYLDRRFQTAPRYLIISILIAFVISNIGLVLQVLRYSRKLNEEHKKNSHGQHDQ
jgi:F0F1-type ATP synthase assembly protein I